MHPKCLALFDFDGTLTTKDTLIEFFKFKEGSLKFFFKLLMISPYLIALKLNLLANWVVKEKFLSRYLKNCTIYEFESRCIAFASLRMPRIERTAAINTMNAHLIRGDRVVIVSASPEHWIRKWVGDKPIEVVATKLEVKDGMYTGRISGKNCHGIEKVNRIKALLDISEYTQVSAYGDSHGDKEMLELATNAYYKKFPKNGYLKDVRLI